MRSPPPEEIYRSRTRESYCGSVRRLPVVHGSRRPKTLFNGKIGEILSAVFAENILSPFPRRDAWSERGSIRKKRSSRFARRFGRDATAQASAIDSRVATDHFTQRPVRCSRA